MTSAIHNYFVAELGKLIEKAEVDGVEHFKLEWPEIVRMAEEFLGEGERVSLPISQVVSEVKLRNPSWKVRHTPSYSMAPRLSNTTIYFDYPNKWDRRWDLKQEGNNGN